MTLLSHLSNSRSVRGRTESEKLQDLRSEAAKIVAKLQRGELTEAEAVRSLNELVKADVAQRGVVARYAG